MNESIRAPEAPSSAVTPWHALEAAEVAARLSTDVDRGLSEAEAGRRLSEGGANRLEETGGPRWPSLLARQFANALIVVLLVAAAVSAAVGERADAITILAIVLLNGALGFAQEWRAERAVAALRRMLAPEAAVLREGGWRHLPAESLVPGDVVQLEAGDRVPADLRLFRHADLRTDEAALTGESLPVHKSTDRTDESVALAERSPMAWSGTTVVHGGGAGIVTATGDGTEFGRIARLARTVVRDPTPLQRQLARLARQLGVASIIVAAAVAAIGLASGMTTLEVFLTGISLAVAVVPEGLPAVVTITLALGIRAMSRRRALLRRLPAAETLGAATVICTDKTGTLTTNEMTVRDVWLFAGDVSVTGAGYEPSGVFEDETGPITPADRPDLLALLETGVLCGHARLVEEQDGWRPVGTPTEAAVGVAARKAGLAESAPEVAIEFPFTSDRKRMTVVLRDGDGLVAHAKGAPEVLLDRCTHVLDGDVERGLTDADREAIAGATASLGESGRRVLAFALRRLPGPALPDEAEAESGMTFLGLVGILDPPRPEVRDAVARARSAGISVIMITGDAPATAVAIARDVGLEVAVSVTGGELDAADDDRLTEWLGGDTVFARTSPAHKLRIVERLQAMGHVVGMTGDGVNDAPALQRADVGIAMGQRGTDVARGAADMVITDDNFASIVGAVEEGRRQYDNIQKFTRYLLSSNAGEVIAIVGNLLLQGPLILLPVQILWMNLVTDGITALALGLEPAEPGVMDRPPRDPGDPILDRRGIARVLAIGAYIGVVAVVLFRVYGGAGPEGALIAQTMAFTAIVVFEKVNVFNFRSLHAPLARTGVLSNPRLLIAWAAMIGLQVCAVYVPFLQDALHTAPLEPKHWLVIAALAIPVFVVPETVKIVLWRRRGS